MHVRRIREVVAKSSLAQRPVQVIRIAISVRGEHTVNVLGRTRARQRRGGVQERRDRAADEHNVVRQRTEITSDRDDASDGRFRGHRAMAVC